jgi:hypothetical protein
LYGGANKYSLVAICVLGVCWGFGTEARRERIEPNEQSWKFTSKAHSALVLTFRLTVFPNKKEKGKLIAYFRFLTK